MKKNLTIVPMEIIERKIYLIRGIKVILDRDLAFLYGVKPIALRQQVKRNRDRFPDDFVFQLTQREANILVSQNVIPSKKSFGGYLPYVFTEHGVAMLSSVLNSKKAVQANIAIVRAFIKLRELLATHKDLILEIERIKREQKGQNQKIQSIISIINQMLNPSINESKEPMGFRYRGKGRKQSHE
jgi:hypothetical protein